MNISTSEFTDAKDVINLIYNKGTMNITDSLFQNNSSTSHEIITNDVNLTITGSKFVNNTAEIGVLTNYNAGVATIYDSTFSGNKGSTGAGAIYNTVGATTNIIAQNQNVIFENNTANGIANDILNNNGTTVKAGLVGVRG